MSQRKNGAPANAVTIPIGSSSGATIVRARTSAQIRKIAPMSAAAGSRRRWSAPTDEADDVRHHQTDEADAAAHRDEHPGGERRDDEPDLAEDRSPSTPSVAAASSPRLRRSMLSR